MHVNLAHMESLIKTKIYRLMLSQFITNYVQGYISILI